MNYHELPLFAIIVHHRTSGRQFASWMMIDCLVLIAYYSNKYDARYDVANVLSNLFVFHNYHSLLNLKLDSFSLFVNCISLSLCSRRERNHQMLQQHSTKNGHRHHMEFQIVLKKICFEKILMDCDVQSPSPGAKRCK